LKEFTATELGISLVKDAVGSLDVALQRSSGTISAEALNLFGFSDKWELAIEISRLREISLGFADLLAGKVSASVSSTDYMPGSNNL